jgi:threonine synthase
MAADIEGYRFTDPETCEIMKNILKEHGYQLDPHGAVALLGLKKYRAETANDLPGLFLETAHPGKFFEVVEQAVGQSVTLPPSLEILKGKKKESVKVSNRFEDAKQLLARS